MDKSITYISKNTINRLIKDITQISKNPLTDNGIYYQHDESDLLKGYALVIGPEDTPYFGGFYLFEFIFPIDYPHSPPKIIYHTNGSGIRFNPNFYKNGKVCLSILNTWAGEQWSSCQTITTILLTLCMVLCQNPLLNEPGYSTINTYVYNYNTVIEFCNINIAICDMINKQTGVYNPIFEMFYTTMKYSFHKNFDKIINIVKQLQDKNSTLYPIIINIPCYSMNVSINYDILYNKLLKCK